MKPMKPMKRLREVFAIPALLAAISLIGLVSALVADGPWNVLSWLLLGGCVAVAIWHSRPRTSSNH